MIAVDTNILIYAHRRDSPWHESARSQVKELAESRATWAIPWPCLHEFLAVVTHARIFSPPTPLAHALAQIDAWVESPSLSILAETDLHWSTVRSLLVASHVSGPQVHDARVAALCLQHGVRVLWTADRDFGRFPALTVENPLIAGSI